MDTSIPNQRIISSFYQELVRINILQYIEIPHQFPDYPQAYLCKARLRSNKDFTDGRSFKTSGWGYSYTSQKEAVIKCLGESIERFAQFCYRKSQFINSSFSELKTSGIDPFIYAPQTKIRTQKISWVRGRNITIKEDCLIPAQLIYFYFSEDQNEPLLQYINTTGAAGGFDQESAMLRAIYETVERDSFMNTFLGKFPAKRINPHSIKNNRFKKLFKYIERYRLEVALFETTTNLEIPSYLCITIDRTGLGPSLSLGSKTSFDRLEAVIGATGESLQALTGIRKDLIKLKSKHVPILPNKITTLRERGLYWANISRLKDLDFLLNQRMESAIIEPISNKKTALENCIKKLRKSGYDVYAVNLTPSIFSYPYYVYKTVIPGLQYLPLNETKKTPNPARLNEVAKHYNTKVKFPNPLPQPFL